MFVMLKSQEKQEGIHEEISIIGVDLAKNVFLIEKLAPFGDRLARPMAFLLIAGGGALLLDAAGVI